jgi:hypothetical protein
VSDIFHEIEEEVRRERLEKIWKEYGDYIVAAVCLLVIAAAGYQLWRVYDQRARAKASDAYTQAEQLFEAGQTDLAAQAFAKIAVSAPSGYAAVARLQEADAMLMAGKRDGAIALYKKIVAENQPLLSDVARIHEGWAIVETATRPQLQSLLAPLTGPANPWRFIAREILAYRDYRSGDTARAAQEYARLAADKNAPAQLHERSLAMATFLKGGGDKDYGSVPALPVQLQDEAAATGAKPSKPAQGSPKK